MAIVYRRRGQGEFCVAPGPYSIHALTHAHSSSSTNSNRSCQRVDSSSIGMRATFFRSGGRIWSSCCGVNIPCCGIDLRNGKCASFFFFFFHPHPVPVPVLQPWADVMTIAHKRRRASPPPGVTHSRKFKKTTKQRSWASSPTKRGNPIHPGSS